MGDILEFRLRDRQRVPVRETGDKKQFHIWGPTRLNHGELQCRRCLMTNREADALRMVYCLELPSSQNDFDIPSFRPVPPPSGY